MQSTDPVLFACYILFVYFNGRNIRRIEREMRALGYPQFHRRILYPRADKPGWIRKYNWVASVAPHLETRIVTSVPVPRSGGRHLRAETRPLGSVYTAAGKPESRTEAGCSPKIPHSAFRSPHFKDWLRTVSPNMTWSWRHQQVIIEQLERVTRGECKRLMIFLPPRHGKSELVTVRYTAWRMQRDPSMNVILGSYNQRLADRFSRKIRKVIADSEVGQTFQSVHLGHSTSEPDKFNPTTHSPEGRLAPASSNHHATHRPQTPSDSNTGGGKPAFRTVTGQVDSARRTISRGQPSCSPFPFVSSKPANSVSEWETTAGGGFRSVGVGSGVTGFGASLIVIDDPIKSRAEAESETYRERVWDWFTDDLYTRLEPDGAIVLIQTRWHEDDLAGRLLREASEEGGEHWDVINLPALSEPSGGNTTVRECVDRASGSPPYEGGDVGLQADRGGSLAGLSSAPSEPDNALNTNDQSHQTTDWRTEPDLPLCPERYNKQALNRIRRRLGEYSFAALYQQRPTPAEGGLFKREWFKKIIPFAPPGLKWKRGYDLAVSTKTNADYTASFRCAFDKEGNLYISGGFRARLEYPDQRRFIIDRIKAEPDTEHGIELALHGQALIQDLRRERGIRGHLLRGVKVEHDKYTRALTWAPLAEEGKVILVRNSEFGMMNPERAKGIPASSEIHHSSFRLPHSPNWISDFLDEVCSFPSAAHDDQVDAVSLAVQMLKGSGKRSWAF